jgi:hypothetical protein
MLEVLKRFKTKYGHLEKKGLKIEGLKVTDPVKKKTVISVSKPFVFDSRLIPKKFDGLEIKRKVHGEMPEEFKVDRSNPEWFKKEYIWAPERFERFVDRCESDIKDELGIDNDASKEELLDALCFGDYEEHKRKTERLVRQGKIPAFTKKEMA